MALTKVKSVQPNGSFENDYGTIQDNPDIPNHGRKLLYKFEYVMEDGTVINANHKYPEGNFKVGESVEYEIKKTHPEHGNSGRVTKPGAGNFQGKTNPSYTAPKSGLSEDARQLMIVRQSSLNRALEILIHQADKGTPSKMVDEIEVIELAGRLTKWVMGEKKKDETSLPEPNEYGHKPEAPSVEKVVAEAKIGETDDLPF